MSGDSSVTLPVTTLPSTRWADISEDDTELPPLTSTLSNLALNPSTSTSTPSSSTTTTTPEEASSTSTSTSTTTESSAESGSTPSHRPLLPAHIDLEILEADITVRTSDPNSPLYSVKSFQELDLPPKLLQGVVDMGFKKPSSIQEKALPLILGRVPQNVIGQAQSGTGKTAAFSLGMLGRVDPNLHFTQALCLAPTRELAIQICDVVRRLARFTSIEIALAVPQAPLPDVKTQVLIGTPGVVKALCSKTGGKPPKVNLSKLRIFVLDEADNMVVSFQQFCKDMKAKCSKQTIFLCFSATFNDDVQRFMEDFVPEPRAELIVKKKTEWSVDQIRQYYVECESIGKYQTLKTLYEYISVGSCILFVETRQTASDLAKKLKAENFTIDTLHADLEPAERDRVMERFRNNQIRILIATNVLARGIDVSQVSMVINFDLPQRDNIADVETYLHRIGRTGRFGRPGVAVSFVHDAHSRKILKDIEDQLQRPISPIDGSNLERISDELNELFTK